MAKLVRIEECDQVCPFYVWHRDHHIGICNHSTIAQKGIPGEVCLKKIKFPNWCPLEDAEEESESKSNKN